MRLLPPPGKGRPLAWILFVITALLGYLLLVHWWFVAPHLAISGEIAQLKEQEARFRAAIASRPQIEQRLQEVRTFESGSPSFLPENDFDSAAAALFSRLKALVAEKAEVPERCEVASHNPKRSVAEELYERVTISVHLRCDIDDFGEVLHAVESSKPVLFVNELNIYRQMTSGARGGLGSRRARPTPGASGAYQLDIRFDLYGYLRKPGPSRTERT